MRSSMPFASLMRGQFHLRSRNHGFPHSGIIILPGREATVLALRVSGSFGGFRWSKLPNDPLINLRATCNAISLLTNQLSCCTYTTYAYTRVLPARREAISKEDGRRLLLLSVAFRRFRRGQSLVFIKLSSETAASLPVGAGLHPGMPQ